MNNKICKLKPVYDEYTYPEWNWEVTRGAALVNEDTKNNGIFINKSPYTNEINIFLKGTPVLKNKTKWTVKILHADKDTNSELCFCIMEVSKVYSYLAD